MKLRAGERRIDRGFDVGETFVSTRNFLSNSLINLVLKIIDRGAESAGDGALAGGAMRFEDGTIKAKQWGAAIDLRIHAAAGLGGRR